MNEPRHILIDHIEHIAVIRLCREERGNSFDDEMIEEFVLALNHLGKSPPRAAVLTGTGDRSFCAGYDVGCIDPDQSTDEPLPDTRFERAILALRDLP